MTRLIVWRHGRTGWNAADRIQGHTDVDLDEVGRVQAVAAAARLAEEHPDVIVASDLRRAADTAAALGAVTGLTVHHDPRLRERCFGEWQGMSPGEVDAAWPDAFARWRRGETIGVAGVEDLADLSKRVHEAMEDAAAMAHGGTVVVTTHGGSAKYGLGALLGWPAEATSQFMGLANCHWMELQRHPRRGWLLRTYNVGAAPALAALTRS